MDKNLLGLLIDLILSWFVKKENITSTVPAPQPDPGQSEIPQPPAIDWTDPMANVTSHFLVGDCLTLHAWNRLATDKDGVTDEIKVAIVALCQKMEEVRKLLGCPINVHCIYRSPNYNTQEVKAIANDVHSMGMAIDFDCTGHFTIEELHKKLEPLLEQLGVRMERNTATWIHLDTHPVKNARYFYA